MEEILKNAYFDIKYLLSILPEDEDFYDKETYQEIQDIEKNLKKLQQTIDKI